MIWSLLSAAVPDVSAAGPRTPLPVCPATPNCVCSEPGTPDDRRVDAFPLSADDADDGPGDPLAAWGLLKAAIDDRGGTLQSDTGAVLHAVFKTPVLRFPDDLFARLDGSAGVIQIRSSSRVGRSDLGANRRRVEALRTSYLARLGGADE